MQTGIKFEKIRRSSQKAGDTETLRLVRQRNHTLRRRARRLANILKGRA